MCGVSLRYVCSLLCCCWRGGIPPGRFHADPLNAGKPAKNSGSVSPTYLVVSIDKGSSDAIILSVGTPKMVPL